VYLGVLPVMTVRELASGIDALYLSGRAELEDSFLDGLERARDRARASDGPVPYRLGGVEFGLAPYGWHRYAFRLSHEYGLIGFTGSKKLPAIRVQPRAELLHGIGARAAFETISGLLASVGDIQWGASRVDLFADVQGWWPTVEQRDRFVCRATTRDTFEESGRLTGFQFGRRKGGGLSARIYDKSGQARKSGAYWWWDKWGDRYVDGEPVTRVEFEAGRTILRECGVDSLDDAIREVAALWGYFTDWLSFRVQSEDLTKSRWPVAPEWEAIRNASLRDLPVTLSRTMGARTAAHEKRVVAGLGGYLASFAAIRDLTGLSDSLSTAESVLRLWEVETGIPFTDRVKRKRRDWEWGL